MGSRRDVALRHSLAPRVLDGRVAQQSLESNARLSVRAAAPASADAPILTTFVWKDSGARVMLAGSFDDWRKHEMTYVSASNSFVLVVEIPPGTYFYRFVVDGRWRVAGDDPNLREDDFGEMSHYIEISADAVAAARPKRFSTASVARSAVTGTVVVDDGASDTEGEAENDLESGSADEQDENDPGNRESPPLPPRQRGNGFVEDYDDDMCGELDLQADVFEAMKDVAEKASDSAPTSPAAISAPASRTVRRRKPGRRMIARVFAVLFGEVEEEEPQQPAPPSRNQKMHAMAGQQNQAGKRGLRVWFPNEQNFPGQAAGRKMKESETKDIIDVSGKAMRLHQVEENASNRQMLGKTLFAQGKYDAALALFSLSVKLREDNGLKNAKTTAIAHTDVASSFIHLEDLKNAEKHLRVALDIFQKGTFSGGRVQLGDVHCFLGVVADMRNHLKDAELCYRNAIDLYEKSRSTDHNPNYSTAIDNLNANIKRQKQAEMAGSLDEVSHDTSMLPQELASTPVTNASIDQRSMSRITPVRSPARGDSQARGKRRPPQGANGSRPSGALPPQSPNGSRPSGALPPQSPNGRNRGGSAAQSPRRQQQTVSPHRRGGHPQTRKDTRGTPKRAPVPGYESDEGSFASSAVMNKSKRQSARPKTWKDLADHARKSMPQAPPPAEKAVAAAAEEASGQVGSYEEMSRGWHNDGRRHLAKSEFKEAIDMYTLAIYTRKRHGPWYSKHNAQTHIECARAQFATRDLRGASESLRDAISILESIDDESNAILLGETWGSLGSVLDRLGGHSKEAESAHCAGMVVLGRAEIATEDKRWMKAWKSLCANLASQGPAGRSADEAWENIELQIRGIQPMSKIDSVVLRL